MPDQDGTVYRKTQLVGTSSVGFDDGVKRALERAQKTLRHVRWYHLKMGGARDPICGQTGEDQCRKARQEGDAPEA
jgi:flavin-binding protein dodecin